MEMAIRLLVILYKRERLLSILHRSRLHQSVYSAAHCMAIVFQRSLMADNDYNIHSHNTMGMGCKYHVHETTDGISVQRPVRLICGHSRFKLMRCDGFIINSITY